MVSHQIKDVINFWSFIEYLQPQEIPAPDPEQLVWRIDGASSFPWRDSRKQNRIIERLRERNRGKNKRKIVFFVYCGIFDSEDIAADLGAWHGFSEHDENQKPAKAKRSAAVLVKLNGEGVVFDISVSSLPWAMGKLKPSTSAKHAEFQGDDGFENIVREKLLDCVSDIEVDLATGEETRIFHEFTLAHFSELSGIVWQESSWIPRKEPHDTFIAGKFVPEDADKIEDDLLNSFIVEDLSNVARKIADDDIGKALDQYLSAPGENASYRRDILRNGDEFQAGLSITQLPSGRWPSKFGLAAAQQYAVNRGLASLKDHGGLFSVNGPPGTGKTTLLKDIVADVVTRRAEVLATFSSPADAFGGRFNLVGNAYPGRKLDKRLLDHLVVVSSSNNAAIENVTKELPAEKSIDVDDLKIDFFKSISDHLLSATKRSKDSKLDDVSGMPEDLPETVNPQVSTWGLISAALGNSDNRRTFVDKFWFGDLNNDGTQAPKSMQAFLKSDAPVEDWITARQKFLSLKARVDEELKALSTIEQDVDRLLSAREQLGSLEKSLQEMVATIVADKKLLLTAQAAKAEIEPLHSSLCEKEQEWGKYQEWAADLARSKKVLSDSLASIHETSGRQVRIEELPTLLRQFERQYKLEFSTKPISLIGLFRPSVTRGWKDRCRLISDKIEQLELSISHKLEYELLLRASLRKPDSDLTEVRTQLDQAWEIIKQRQAEIESAKIAVSGLENRVSKVTQDIQKTQSFISSTERNLLSFGLNDSEVMKLSPSSFDNFHITVPLLASRLMTTRHSLFVSALELHKSFIGNAKSEMRANLSLLCDYLRGAAAPNSAGMSHLWNTLALCIPVVSTTFASFPRLFRCMERESIGWLLLDESGQATPQAPVGAIWRSRRAIVVGDPLQLEPVVTLPESSIEILREKFHLDDDWHPVRQSCQVLADRSNEFGTYIGSDDDRRWVGSPLVVHRRCLNPMFKVANKIAYDDLMIYGTQEPTKVPDFDAGPSSWIDAKPTAGNIGHWIPSQGHLALRMVQRVEKAGAIRNEDGSYNIFVITPYRDISKQMVDLLERNGIEDAKRICGTIHTFQGREADTVILLLGGDPQKRNAVGAFAAKTPNLLNVAITRAKRRIHVIGDSALWSGARYFSELYRAL